MILTDLSEYNAPIYPYEINGECLLWHGRKSGKGYGSAVIQGKSHYIHRISWSFAHGVDIPHGMVIAHKCDTPNCYNSEHLFLCSIAENLQDMHRKGRAYSGDKHWTRTNPNKVRRGSAATGAKLTIDQVRAIRSAYAPSSRWNRSGNSIYDLAERYGVGAQTISRIINNVLWSEK